MSMSSVLFTFLVSLHAVAAPEVGLASPPALCTADEHQCALELPPEGATDTSHADDADGDLVSATLTVGAADEDGHTTFSASHGGETIDGVIKPDAEGYSLYVPGPDGEDMKVGNVEVKAVDRPHNCGTFLVLNYPGWPQFAFLPKLPNPTVDVGPSVDPLSARP